MHVTVILWNTVFAGFVVRIFVIMWYEILPSFFIVTAGVGLPGWALYHIHNLTIGNVSKEINNLTIR